MPLRSRSRNGFIMFVLHYRWIPTVVIHLTAAAVTNYAAFLLRFDGHVPTAERALWLYTLPLLLASRAGCFFGFRLYQGLWRYTSIWDLRNMVASGLLGTGLFAAAVHGVIGATRYPRSVYVVDTLLLIVTLSAIGLSHRIYSELSRDRRGKRVLVFGAGNAAELIVRDMKVNRDYGYQPIGFVDDDVAKVGRRIHGVQVLGTRSDLSDLLARHKPDEVLIAMPDAEPASIRAIVRALEPFKLPIKTLPKLSDIIGGRVELNAIRNLAVEDLLARPPVGLDPLPVKHLIRGRRVMVTGAGGSIGSELCRQIVKLRPASLVMFERYENSLHAIRMELEDTDPACGLHSVVGDVADTACVSAVMQQHLPEIVFHAAAHKHVPLMEENPCEAIKNNVRGTRLLAQAAEFFGVDRFIFISTDKAVNPTSVMGGSKRLAELAIQTQAMGSGTSFAVVRFGNVLGSNGSVVPRFLDQIRKGGPVTITHPDMRRFFMLIPEAVQLVMHAASQAESGGIYVLEMGEQVKLVDMAKDLIRLAGFVPDEEIPIEFIGPRPGEKLFEELVGMNEVAGPSAIDKIHRVTSRRRPDPEFFSHLEAIERQAAAGDVGGVRQSLKELIPEYMNPADIHATQATETSDTPVEPDSEEEAEIAQLDSDVLYQYCPSCISARVHRSRARNLIERVKRRMTAERLFRCEACGWRGWLMPLVSMEGDPVDQQVQPDFAVLDTFVAPSASPTKRPFSPRDLP